MLEKFGGSGANQRAKYEKRHLNMGKIHFEGLYDENEDRAGEKRDLATGKPIDNSKDDLGPINLKIKRGRKKSQDALPPLPEENDEAARWLKEQEIKRRKAA